MSKTGTTRVTVKPGEAPPRGKTDWARVNAMTDDEVLAGAASGASGDPGHRRLLHQRLVRK